MRLRAVHPIFILLTFGGGLTATPPARSPERVGAPPAVRPSEDAPAQAAAGEQGGARVPIHQHPSHPQILAVLKDLVARFGKARLNTFYVSPAARKAEGEQAYIYWKQDNSIIVLNLPLEKPAGEESAFWLYTGKARIDLAEDVAPTEEQVGSSTFLVSKPWVDTVIKDCVSNGRKVVIPRRAGRRRARASWPE